MAKDTYRFRSYQRLLSAERNKISLNALISPVNQDADGKPKTAPFKPVKLTSAEAIRLLKPYASVRFFDQVRAVVPLALYLALFHILFLQHMVEDSWQISAGLFAVVIGLMFFMEGLQLGLMPFGTLIGNRLPRKSPLPLVLLITLLLGVGVTFAEPAIGALQAAGGNVDVHQAPYLYAILND